MPVLPIRTRSATASSRLAWNITNSTTNINHATSNNTRKRSHRSSSTMLSWIVCASALCLATVCVLPLVLLQHHQTTTTTTTAMDAADPASNKRIEQQHGTHKASVHHAVHGISAAGRTPQTNQNAKQNAQSPHQAAVAGAAAEPKVQPAAAAAAPTLQLDAQGQWITKDGRHLAVVTLSDLAAVSSQHDEATVVQKPVARGVAGVTINSNGSHSSATEGAHRAHIHCPDLNVDSLAYWNDPIGTRDLEFVSPFSVDAKNNNNNNKNEKYDEKYISFAPDNGGWNNVRMSMEIIFVIAAATGRTLVLPPKEPLYLLHHDAAARHRGFADFFPLHTPAFQNSGVKVLAFEDFLQREHRNPTLAPESPAELATLTAAADHCDNRANSDINCQFVFDYLKRVGYSPDISAAHTCLVFDEKKYHGLNVTADVNDYLHTVCGPNRKQFFWDQDIQQHKLVHFRASEREFRLLAHFYGMIHFTNPAIDHYYKRFVRDFLHYHDEIYCAAGKIVKAVQAEGINRDFAVDEEGAGAFSALHVRRGDLQYKKVKIPAQEWYDNTKEVWQPKEILYVATDERDKSFFDDLAKHHDLRFLDDYWDLAGLGAIDPNYMGMIDTIVASRGRAFAGTWFSTFSGYINRLRGYHGMSMMDSWYSFLPKKTAVHEWRIVDDFAYAFEWPDGWVGIDGDEFPTRDKF